MPVIGIPVDMLNERIATRLDPDVMVTKLQQLGCDVEGYATLRRYACQTCTFLMEITETENPPVECQACGVDYKAQPELLTERGTNEVIRMELLAVRPDMFDPAGLARTLRGYLGEKLGPVEYSLQKPTLTVNVQAELENPENPLYRPIRCAVVRGVELNEDRIKVLMKLQENLHWAMGRDRKRASIGCYDLGAFAAAQGIDYRLTPHQSPSFVPLGKSEAMTPKEVLEKHPRGADYAHLLAGRQLYPLLVGKREDGSEVVLSLIPIINSEATKVVHGTKDLLVDVTGVEPRLVEKILNTMVTALLELCPGSSGEQVTIAVAGGSSFSTPDLTPQEVELDTSLPARRIGVDLDAAQVQELLMKMGHGVREGTAEGTVIVSVPAYRNDILHPVDLVEDVAIAYGYHNIRPSLVPTFTVGLETPRSTLMNRTRQALTGLGYHEVLTLILSNEADQFEKIRRKDPDQHVLVSHPISIEQTMIRTSLLPGLLDTFSVNTDHPLPQRIFEVGRITLLDSAQEVGAREQLRVAAAVIGSRADFTEVKAVVESLLRDLGFASGVCRAIEESDAMFDTFIPGRGAVWGAGDTAWVSFGELHPQVLENFGLAYPVAFLEIDLEVLLAN